MSRWYLAAALSFGCCGLALAQTGQAVNSGVSSNDNTMSGPNIDVVNGLNPNGTPRQQSPGASMTVGAGNSTMLPGTGNSINGPASPVGVPTTVPAIPKETIQIEHGSSSPNP